VAGDTITADLPRGSWSFFPQRFQQAAIAGVNLMPVDLPYDGPCVLIEGKGDIRFASPAIGFPTCLGYVAADTTSIEVDVEASPINIIWGHSKSGPDRVDGRLVVAPGAPTEFVLSGMRTATVWPSLERAPFDAPIAALAIDDAEWGRIAGPEDRARGYTLTPEKWKELSAAAATSAVGWNLALDADELVVTAPDSPGERVHVAVAGFGPTDESTRIWDDVLEVALGEGLAEISK
jgi:hypothetical protein